MIKKLLVVRSGCFEARYNQAVEAVLLGYAEPETLILYLWQNDNAVFIGKNQNAYLECDLVRLEADGGTLCRRITGGGAVYHDKGNVNFSFIANKDYYDAQRQFSIVLEALNNIGITAGLSGRNDIEVEGRKCSGNAYYRTAAACLHHGTILINAGYQKIAEYLTASKVKLQTKGVESVVKRVINLHEINPAITAEEVFEQLIIAALNITGAEICNMTTEELDKIKIEERLTYFSDPKRILGDNIYYEARLERRFSWGTADIRLKIDRDVIKEAKIYSDALDTELVAHKERILPGKNINDAIEALEHE